MPDSSASVHLGGNLMSSKVSSMLIREIKVGDFRNAIRLPAETILAERFQVSRTVIRDALASLEREGFVDRVRGIGTVINHGVTGLTSRLDLRVEYDDLIREMGYEPSSDCVSIVAGTADVHLAQSLQVQVGTPLLVREKRLLAGAVPVIYSIDCFPASLFAQTNQAHIDWGRPIFDIFEQYCGIVISLGAAQVSATNSDSDIRKKLDLSDGCALLLLEEVGYNRLGRPVLHAYEYYTDFFPFTVLRKNL